jgi:outer membrane protein assembly factor BamB
MYLIETFSGPSQVRAAGDSRGQKGGTMKEIRRTVCTLGLVSSWLLFAFCHGPCGARELLVGSWQTHSIGRFDLETNQYQGHFVVPGSGGLSTPDGMDFGADGHLYVSSSQTNRVLRYDGTSGAFLGAFASTQLNQPGNLQFGPDGLLYVANKGTGQVLRYHPQTGNLVDVFATGGGLRQPVGLLWDQGVLYVSDFTGNAIRRFDANTGAFIDTFANVSTPLILNLDPEGKLLVSSHQDSTIWKYDTTTGARLGSALSGGPVSCPVGHLYVDGNLIVASWQNHRLLRYGLDGTFVETIGAVNAVRLPNDLLLRPVPEPGSFVGLIIAGWAFVRRRGNWFGSDAASTLRRI